MNKTVPVQQACLYPHPPCPFWENYYSIFDSISFFCNFTVYWQLHFFISSTTFFIFFCFNDELYNDIYEKFHVFDQYDFYILRMSSFPHRISLKASFGNIVQGVGFRDPVVFFFFLHFHNPHVEHFCWPFKSKCLVGGG